MKYYLTLDGGTTNTRIGLVKCGTLIDTYRISLGARSGIGGNDALKAAIREGIGELLSRHDLNENDIHRILASGMITSEFGLCKLDHILAPAGISELHETMHETSLPEISKIPFVFIRGVKTVGGTLSETDMMRGEETELMGILQAGEEATLYVLPGSHSKLILTDQEGKITRFSTMMTGEMIAALSSGTILKDAVDLSVDTVDESALTGGYEYAHRFGMNEALFKVRILKNLFGKDRISCYSFFLGVILSSEIDAILTSDAERVVIGGREQIKQATALLLRARSDKTVIVLTEEEVACSTTLGMLRVYEYGASS